MIVCLCYQTLTIHLINLIPLFFTGSQSLIPVGAVNIVCLCYRLDFLFFSSLSALIY
jgi:hypothetical protein